MPTMKVNRLKSSASPPQLNSGAVHVWDVSLDEALPDAAAAVLSAEERGRAARLVSPLHGRRFTAARSALRHVLAGYLDIGPAAVPFRYGEHGKPDVDLPNSSLQFNLSHSQQTALIAVASARRVGVDVEHGRSGRRWAAIVRRFFSEREINELFALPSARQRDAFLAGWARKEAYIKALGLGLACPLQSFSVSVTPGTSIELIPSHTDPVGDWSVYELDAGDDCAAALVAEGVGHHVHRFRWRFIHGDSAAVRGVS